jgi:DnaJ-class molecular chaperone
LIIKPQIKIPKVLSKEEKELYEKIKEISKK